MKLNIKKVGKSNYLIDVRVRHNGKRIRKRENFKGTLKDAEARYLELSNEIRGTTFDEFSEAPTTFNELIKIYEGRRQIDNPTKSRIKVVRISLGGVALNQFKKKFEIYINILKETPTEKTGKVPANATINRTLQLVKAIFQLSEDLEIISKNPVTAKRFPNLVETPRDKILDSNELLRLRNIIKKDAPHLEAIFNYSLLVPCRKSELINMRVRDMDLIGGSIRVKNGTTKNRRGLYKPIPEGMIDYFRNIPNDSEFVFYKKVGGNKKNPEIQYRALGDFKKSWTTCLDEAGIEDFHFHDLRHISASDMVNSGTPERLVMEIAGWTTDMLRNYYHRGGQSNLHLVQYKQESNRVHTGYNDDLKEVKSA